MDGLDVYRKRIGGRLKQLREGSGIPAKQIAERVGYSTNHIYELEKGTATPSLKLLIQLGEIFGVSPAFFIEEEKPTPDPILLAPVVSDPKPGVPLHSFVVGYRPVPEKLATKGRFFYLEYGHDIHLAGFIPKPTLLLVKEARRATPNSVVVALVKGKALMREILYDHDKGLIILRWWSMDTPPIVLHPEELQLLGIVVAVEIWIGEEPPAS